MRSFLSTRFARYLLSPLLAIWVAGGGCLFGCEGKILAAVQKTAGIFVTPGVGAHHVPTEEPLETEPKAHHQTVQEGASCASGEAHHCCAKSPARSSRAHAATRNVRAAKPVAATPATVSVEPVTLTASAAVFGSPPSGMMEGCPLAVNATAVVSNFRNDQNDPAIPNASSALRWLTSIKQSSPAVPPPLLPTLNLTYLNCCVFLI